MSVNYLFNKVIIIEWDEDVKEMDYRKRPGRFL